MHPIFKVLEGLTEKLTIPKMEAWQTIDSRGAPTPVKIEITTNSETEVEGDHIVVCLSFFDSWCALVQFFCFRFKDYTVTLEAETDVVCPTMQRVYHFEKKLPEHADRFYLYKEDTPIHKQLDFLEQLLKATSLKKRLQDSCLSISKRGSSVPLTS